MSIIKDGLVLPADRHGRVAIPNCQRNELPGFFVEMGYKKGVEIGTYRGDFAIRFAKEGLEIHTVDPWEFTEDYHPKRRGNQKRCEELCEVSKKKLAPYPNAHIIRKTSMEAVKDFENESIDFVYIDGHHGFKFVTEDIYEWSKKVRRGGIISGHDYGLRVAKHNPKRPFVMQVKFVLDAYTKALRIRRWYILGRGERRPNEVRELYRSWMWFKE